MPDAWKNALEGRRIFLLNTHLNNIINEADCMIRGLEQVIEAFKCRENGAVIWRPHPLSMETLKSFQPQFCEIYNEVIEKAKKSKRTS